MPIAPTQRLVVTGFNRYVRNPMYLGLLVVMVGEALLFGSLAVLLGRGILDHHGVICPLVRGTHPGLRQYGSQYEEYRRNVHAWLPRLHPWTPGLRTSHT